MRVFCFGDVNIILIEDHFSDVYFECTNMLTIQEKYDKIKVIDLLFNLVEE